MNQEDKDHLKAIAILLFIAVLLISFFATTWLVMILAGMAGHTANNQWLMHLSFWKCAPAWLFLVLLKAIL